MPDPLGFPMLAGSAITQAFGFLYGRLAVLLDRRSARHAEEEYNDQKEEEEQVDIIISGQADQAILEELRPSLYVLASLLDVYDKNPEMIDGGDDTLRRNLGYLRAALEAIYHQRIAFTGEDHRSQGVRIDQDAEEISGELIAIVAREVSRSAQVDISQKLKKIHKDGKVIGAKITTIE